MKLLMMMRYAWRRELTVKTSNGSPMALASTEPHAVWLKLMIPHLELTQTMDRKYREITRNHMVWETLSVEKSFNKI